MQGTVVSVLASLQLRLNMTIEVSDRLAVDSDFDFIWTLYSSSVKPVISKLIQWQDDEQKVRFRETLDLNAARIAVIEAEPIGWFALAESETTLDLEQLFIVEKYRRKGLGRGIASWARGLADEKSLQFRLPTLDDPAAIAFSKSLGLSDVRLDRSTLLFS